MKTLQEILAETVNKPRSEDEQRFIDKHVVVKKDHPVAGEDQFTKKAKKAKRPADYDEGEDETVNENHISGFIDFIIMSEENLAEATSIRVDIPYFDDEPARAKKVANKHRVKVVDKGRDYQITGDKKSIVKFLMDKDTLEWDKDEIQNEFPELFESVQIDEISSDALRTYKSRARNRLRKLNKKIVTRTATDKEKYRAIGHEHGIDTATKKLANRQESAQIIEAKFVPGNMKLKDGSSVKVTREDVKALSSLFDELNGSNKKKMEERMMEDKKGFEEILKFAKEAM